ncbi:MAG: hypothetical protein ACI970_000107 [Myxococcota bacterium]|jgi:hypothetical protein
MWSLAADTERTMRACDVWALMRRDVRGCHTGLHAAAVEHPNTPFFCCTPP